MMSFRTTIASSLFLALAASPAWAQDAEGGVGVEAGADVGGDAGASAEVEADVAADADGEEEGDAKDSQKGKFDVGAKLRFPSGEDDEGEYALFNWVALDLRGQYGLTEKGVIAFKVPLAILRPDAPDAPGAPESELFGGFTVGGTLGLGDLLGVGVTVGMMRQGAFLLSEHDAPAYYGDLKVGAVLGPRLDLRTGVLNLAASLDLVTQAESAGDMMEDTLFALSVPVSALVQVGDLLKVGVQAGVHSGAGFSLAADEGARLPVVAALSVRLGDFILDGGLGFASLLTSEEGAYPTIKDSLTVGLNARWAK